MGNTTDELIRLAHEVSPSPHPREYDMLVSTGERISNALCAMAIHDLGHEAVSLTGSQAGIVTDSTHTKAKIVEVRAQRIHDALEREQDRARRRLPGRLDSTHDVTTLGRGGSDTTAVALAAALGADACEIFTDVAGVFTADPRIVPGALKLDAVTYEEMLEMSASGAKVMALRSIEVARSYGVKLRVRSTFVDGEGTWIGEEDDAMLEKAIISGVTHDTSEAKVSIVGVPDRPGIAAQRLPRARGRRREHRHDRPERVADGAATISFTLPKTDRADRRADPRRAAADRARTASRRPGGREDLADRRGHEEPSRSSPPTCSTRSPRRASTSRSSRRRRSASPA